MHLLAFPLDSTFDPHSHVATFSGCATEDDTALILARFDPELDAETLAGCPFEDAAVL